MGLLSGAMIGLELFYQQPSPGKSTLTSSSRTAAIPLVRHEMALLDPALTAGYAPAPFGGSAPLRSRFERAEAEGRAVEAALETEAVQGIDVDQEAAEPRIVPEVAAPALVREIPVPIPRPSAATPPRPSAPRTRLAEREPPPTPAAAAPPSDGRTLLERMFGAPAAPPGNPALAYAAPGDVGGGFFGNRAGSTAGSGTAIYNIARHTVTLPSGVQLEAHSGLGIHLDDPGSVAERMRGATPPTLYELSQREALFHGVRALRLTPLLEGTTFGRGGLLAHTFMLGPRGDSNGCVVFRNYAAFLAAFDTGQVRRLLVVKGS